MQVQVNITSLVYPYTDRIHIDTNTTGNSSGKYTTYAWPIMNDWTSYTLQIQMRSINSSQFNILNKPHTNV